MKKEDNQILSNITFTRTQFNNHYLHVYRTKKLMMGYTELDFSVDDLSQWFSPNLWVGLEQIHSDTIYHSSAIYAGLEGDGIILDQKNVAAVIETADCTPLFFWDDLYACGGVLHIGWKGLLKGIEQKLLNLLQTAPNPVDIKKLNFHLGPAIEKKCYPVGDELFDAFSTKDYRDAIFTPAPEIGKNKYLMDVQAGIRMSLRDAGIDHHRISGSNICTYCEANRFPSYRRKQNTGKRIYNFLILNP